VRRDATEHTRNVGRHCAVAAEQAMAATGAKPSTAERRQLTVLFADLVG
jgi:class 3 adenylate cyclase